MALTADEIEQHRFKERFRGYDPEEVDAFLQHVAAGLRAVERERDQARRERDAARHAVERAERGTEESEDLLRKTLVSAQRTAEHTVADARADAERIRERAGERAERIVADARQQARDVADAIEGLLGVHGRLRASIQDVLDQHAALLDREGGLPATAEVIAQLRRLADDPAPPADTGGTDDDRRAAPATQSLPAPPDAASRPGGPPAAEPSALELDPPPPPRTGHNEDGTERG